MCNKVLEHDIPEERERTEIQIQRYIAEELILQQEFYEDARILYPKTEYPDDEKFRVRYHKSKSLEKEPNMLEILVPVAAESNILPIPFCTESQLGELSDYYNVSGVYIFYGPDDHSRRKPLYIGESRNIWGRILEHLYGSGNTKSIKINSNSYSPYKYFRWIEIFNLDSPNQRKLLEQALIAVKRPSHNYYTEKRDALAERNYKYYLNKHKSITSEIVQYPKQDWDYFAYTHNSIEKEYYLERYNLKKEEVPARDITNLQNYIREYESKYNDNSWEDPRI